LYSSLFFKYKLAELQVPVERREVVAVSAAVTASAFRSNTDLSSGNIGLTFLRSEVLQGFVFATNLT